MSEKTMNFAKNESLVPVEKPDAIKINFDKEEKNNSLFHEVEKEKTFSSFPMFPQGVRVNLNTKNIYSDNYNSILLNKIEEFIKYNANMGDFTLTNLLSSIFLYRNIDFIKIHDIDIISHINFVLNRMTCQYRCEPKILLNVDNFNHMNIDMREIYFIRVK
ncbi:hypothetical protein [uncultured Clostridium sp.]|uniref:hypothetical protein n=1 Tax=uncultured Clostridium sp. TaxID=59620 RepID=UPI00263A9C15|nr:hypothetical protein [uncultured Clostridium sp.]